MIFPRPMPLASCRIMSNCLDLGVRGEEGFGLFGGGTGGADQGHVQALRRSERMASKLAIRRSTCALLRGRAEISIMLWKGAMRVPRLMRPCGWRPRPAGDGRHRPRVPFFSGPGAQMNSTRAPTRTTCQGARWRSMIGFRKAVGEAFGQLLHMGVVFRGHHLGQVGDAGRRTASGWRTAWCPCPNTGGAVGVDLLVPRRGVVGQAPDGGGHAARHAFADDEDVGRSEWTRV
jgi:hypothetical protein